MAAEHNGTDALMAALTGEELSDEARADAAFMTGHRAAEADLALLREQLALIGDALAAQAPPRPEPAPVRAPRDRHRVRRFAFAAVTVAAVGGMLAGMAWLVAQNGGSGSASSASGDAKAAPSAAADGSSLASPARLACMRLVAEGDVTDVKPVPAVTGQERVTLHVTRSYKPARSPKEVVFVLEQGLVEKALHKGDRILVALPEHSAVADRVVVGAQEITRERAGLVRALPEAAGLRCGG
ncbi:hypothetical protein [Streptomyces sp. NPDC057616]|uniref:hypothetical protein n=1 Tax=Streptomyces sp. NPDC057616 TaxID=3346183 RepID=UPI0036B2B420